MRFLGFVVVLSILCYLNANELNNKNEFQLRMLKATKRHAQPSSVSQENNNPNGDFALPMRQAFAEFVNAPEFNKDEIDPDSYQEYMKKYIDSLPNVHNRYMTRPTESAAQTASSQRAAQQNPSDTKTESVVKSVMGATQSMTDAEAREQAERFTHMYDNIQGKAMNENLMAELNNDKIRQAIQRMNHQDLNSDEPVIEELAEIVREQTVKPDQVAREQHIQQQQQTVAQQQQNIQQQPAQQQNIQQQHPAPQHMPNIMMPGMPGMPGMPVMPGMPPMPGMPTMQSMPPMPGMPMMQSMPGMPGMPSMHPGAIHHANMMQQQQQQQQQQRMPHPGMPNFAMHRQMPTLPPQVPLNQGVDRRAQAPKNLQGAHLNVKAEAANDNNDRYQHFYESIDAKKAHENSMAKSRHITRP